MLEYDSIMLQHHQIIIATCTCAVVLYYILYPCDSCIQWYVSKNLYHVAFFFIDLTAENAHSQFLLFFYPLVGSSSC